MISIKSAGAPLYKGREGIVHVHTLHIRVLKGWKYQYQYQYQYKTRLGKLAMIGLVLELIFNFYYYFK